MSNLNNQSPGAKGQPNEIYCQSCHALLGIINIGLAEGDGILNCQTCGAHNSFLITSGKLEVLLG